MSRKRKRLPLKLASRACSRPCVLERRGCLGVLSGTLGACLSGVCADQGNRIKYFCKTRTALDNMCSELLNTPVYCYFGEDTMKLLLTLAGLAITFALPTFAQQTNPIQNYASGCSRSLRNLTLHLTTAMPPPSRRSRRTTRFWWCQKDPFTGGRLS